MLATTTRRGDVDQILNGARDKDDGVINGEDVLVA